MLVLLALISLGITADLAQFDVGQGLTDTLSTLVFRTALIPILSPIFPEFAQITLISSLLPGSGLKLGLRFLGLIIIGWNTLSAIELLD